MKIRYLSIHTLICLCLLVCSLLSCSDKIDKSDIYTFKGMTVADYIRSCPSLSIYAQLMDVSQVSDRSQSTVSSLLGIYGHFTVFVPTDQAIRDYLDNYYGKDNYRLDTLPQTLVRKIVNSGIIDMGKEDAWKSRNIPSGYLPDATVNGLYLYFERGDFGEGATIRINDQCRLTREDIEADNGYVNIIDHVIQPGPSTIPGLIAATDNLRIFSLLLETTSWADSMTRYRDDDYIQLRISHPRYRLFNYTVFAETDDVFQREWNVPAPEMDEDNVMTNWQDILQAISQHCAEITPDATSTDYTSSDNAVNQFVSYHLLPFLEWYKNWATLRNEYGANTYLYEKGLADIPHDGGNPPSHAVYYYQTMGKPNRLIQLTYLPQPEKEGVYINRHSLFDPSRGGHWQELACMREGALILPDNGQRKQYAANGIYYPINHILTYDKDVPEKVLNQRIRYHEFMNLPEEITTLSVGPNNGFDTSSMMHIIPLGFCDNMIGNMANWIKGSNFFYMAYNLIIHPSSGEFKFKLLPVPFAGEWEIRISHLYNILHCYLGNSKNGPMEDLGIKYYTKMWAPEWEPDYNGNYEYQSFLPDTMVAIEQDKQCRQHGFMKMPFGFGMISHKGVYHSARCYKSNIGENGYIRSFPNARARRTIIYRGFMTPEKDYWVKVKELASEIDENRYYLDCIELVPRSVYANPDREEDWW